MKYKSSFSAILISITIVSQIDAIPPVPLMPQELLETLKTSLNYYNDTSLLLGKAELLQNYITKMKEYWDTILNDLKIMASSQGDMEKIVSTIEEGSVGGALDDDNPEALDYNPAPTIISFDNFRVYRNTQMANKAVQDLVMQDLMGIDSTSEEILAFQAAMEGETIEPIPAKILEDFLTNMNKKTDSVVQKLVRMENQVKQIEKKISDYQKDFFTKKLKLASKMAELNRRRIFILDKDEL